jgi:hypothetical protein
MGAVPGYVLVALVLIAIALAAKALLLPGRVVPLRKGEAPWWVDLRDDWNHWWHRHLGRGSGWASSGGASPGGASPGGASSQRRRP